MGKLLGWRATILGASSAIAALSAPAFARGPQGAQSPPVGGHRPLVLMYHDIVPRRYEDATLCKKARDVPDRFAEQIFCQASSDVTFSNFLQQVKWLHDSGYVTLSADEFYAIRTGRAPVPPKSVLITFDDGYDGNYFIAAPLLSSLDMKATFFVHTNYVKATQYPYPPLSPEAAAANSAPDGAAAPAAGESLHSSKNHMTWEQLRSLEAVRGRGGVPLFKVYSHTLTHPRLPDITADDLRKEICNSRVSLETNLGGTRTYFAYPWGRYVGVDAHFNALQPFDAHVIDQVRACGYVLAFSITNFAGTPNDLKTSNLLAERMSVDMMVSSLTEFKTQALAFEQVDLAAPPAPIRDTVDGNGH